MATLNALEKRLERLDKLALVAALMDLSRSNKKVWAHCSSLVANASPESDELALQGLRLDLEERIRETDGEAEECCCGKNHLYDDSERVYDVAAVHAKWIIQRSTLSPEAVLKALCHLADELQPRLEGGICEVEGDEVLIQLDTSVVKVLEAGGTSVSAEVLNEVAQVFSDDYEVWKECQGYGIFEDAPSQLRGGPIARRILQEKKKSSNVGSHQKKKTSTTTSANENVAPPANSKSSSKNQREEVIDLTEDEEVGTKRKAANAAAAAEVDDEQALKRPRD